MLVGLDDSESAFFLGHPVFVSLHTTSIGRERDDDDSNHQVTQPSLKSSRHATSPDITQPTQALL